MSTKIASVDHKIRRHAPQPQVPSKYFKQFRLLSALGAATACVVQTGPTPFLLFHPAPLFTTRVANMVWQSHSRSRHMLNCARRSSSIGRETAWLDGTAPHRANAHAAVQPDIGPDHHASRTRFGKAIPDRGVWLKVRPYVADQDYGMFLQSQRLERCMTSAWFPI